METTGQIFPISKSPDTLSFVLECFDEIWRESFKDLRNFFYGNIKLNVWIQFSQLKEKLILFGLWGWEVTQKEAQLVNITPHKTRMR